ncbi:cyclic nucleotide-binding/CBS domain-containing protein [Vibrio metschnikovii]|nr:cyclic nucleotide-binding/CBS domain-containing protein [Vibrio metschnikovii]EKO3887494.1 cyclic nucleotide-binding/CBS domain-containing protein [Vibrio metschnikovii]EKO3936631.1 cyclic nucleotide-binding/CBS domain-containing protein [Vibrio metschnikovii]
MPDKFNMLSPPFSSLSEAQQQRLRAALDIAYYREHDVLIQQGQACHQLWILIKGTVEERSVDGKTLYAHYTNEDMFDVRALFETSAKHQYVALEDTLSYLLPKKVFLALCRENRQFSAYFETNLAKRQELIEVAQQQKNLAEFILTKIEPELYLAPTLVKPDQTLAEVTQEMKSRRVDAALVEWPIGDRRADSSDTPPYGIVTRSNLLHAIMLEGHTQQTEVGEIATSPILHIQQGDFLFNAMISMTRHKVKRLVVCEGRKAVGILSMVQILSAFSTHSHVLTLTIARATSIDELAFAANKQQQLVESLLNRGIRTRFIMELIAAVNEQIIEKAFQLIVPSEAQQQCCFVVLGSEGRGEQILKTDQDNALIIADEAQWSHSTPWLETLTHTLVQLGYPLCPGKVMVNNPHWVQSQTDWQTTISHWIQTRRPEHMLNLAIFADAYPVAGNKALLAPVKHHLQTRIYGQYAVLAEFTRPALNFSLPLTLFGHLKSSKSGLDIKKGGIFPIIHGVRALSLEYQISSTNTFQRIEALQAQQALEKQTADNLREALKLFLKLRLAQQITNQHHANHIQLGQLDRTERDLLRHSLHVVKKFKQWLSYHYQIRE